MRSFAAVPCSVEPEFAEAPERSSAAAPLIALRVFIALRATYLVFDGGEENRGLDLKPLCDPIEGFQRRPSCSALDRAEMGMTNIRQSAEDFLRYSPGFSALLNDFADDYGSKHIVRPLSRNQSTEKRRSV